MQKAEYLSLTSSIKSKAISLFLIGEMLVSIVEEKEVEGEKVETSHFEDLSKSVKAQAEKIHTYADKSEKYFFKAVGEGSPRLISFDQQTDFALSKSHPWGSESKDAEFLKAQATSICDEITEISNKILNSSAVKTTSGIRWTRKEVDDSRFENAVQSCENIVASIESQS